MAEKKPQKIELWSLGQLKPNPNNPRTHTPEQIAQLCASIEQWGWTNPILVDEDGNVLAGHGRLMAAESLQLAKVPVIVTRGWSEDQKKAYTIADNKLAMNAGWDLALLSVSLNELEVAAFDMDLLGFSEDDLARMQTDLDQLALANMAGDSPGKGGTPAQKQELQDGTVAFSLVMATDARKVLQEAIAVAKERYGYQTAAEALVAICRQWMDDRTGKVA
jgi:ParB-like chromosome segregation protein Spo0J